MAAPLTYDIRIWLSAGQYAGLLRLAHADDRPMSAYVRRLIQKALDEELADLLPEGYAPGGAWAGRDDG
jgi:hypothetical protein